jgi:hypothetical protein
MYIDNLTGIEFTFRTDDQYEDARMGGYIENYKIARVEVTYDDGSRIDAPYHSFEEFQKCVKQMWDAKNVVSVLPYQADHYYDIQEYAE